VLERHQVNAFASDSDDKEKEWISSQDPYDEAATRPGNCRGGGFKRTFSQARKTLRGHAHARSRL